LSFGAFIAPFIIPPNGKFSTKKIIDHGLWKVHLLLYTWAYPTQQNSSRDPNKIPFKASGNFSSYVYLEGTLLCP
jgi:hypothetical protein